ncbi:uncharacterized protein LOC144558653 [Carex rostrata]
MASKAMVLFGVLLVVALFVTSEVAAQQTQATKENKAGTQDYRGGGPGYNGGYNGGYGPGNGHGGGGGPYCRWGCCRRGYHNGCSCCMHPDQIRDPMYIPEVQN